MMKRTVKNEKVLRAITIGLATMIAASSAPVNVFAAEEGEAGVTDNNDNTSNAESNDMAPEQVEMACGDVEEAQDYAEELTEPASDEASEDQESQEVQETQEDQQAPAAEDTVTEEATEGNPSVPQLIETVEEAYSDEAVAEVKESIVADLNEAEEKIENVKDNLDQIADDLNSGSNDISVKNVNAFDVTTKPVEVIKTEEKEDENGETVTAPVINEDNTVETTQSSDPMLVDFVDSYNNAVSNIQAGNITVASGFATEAEAKLDEAEDTITRLGTAIKDSKAAEAAVKRAKEKAEIMAGLKDQYEKFMVHYYREKLGYGKDNCVYDYDENGIGTLNIEKTAEKMINFEKVNVHPNPGDTKYVGRALLEQVVRLSLIEQGVDPDSIEYGINTDGQTELAGDPNETSNKGTWTVKNNLNKVDRAAEDNESLYWFNVSDSAKNGRNNHVAVRYIDKDGNTKIECFNIIYKDIADEKKENNDLVIDAADLAKSPVFISKVTYNETSKSWEHQAYTDEARKAAFADVYDAKMLEAANEAYKNAQADFEAAEAKATALRAAVEKLGFDISGREAWENELENAMKAVENSRSRLEILNKVIAQLTPAGTVGNEAGNVTPAENVNVGTEVANDDTSDDTEASTVLDAGSAMITIPGIELPTIALPTPPSGVAGVVASGVLGVRADEDEFEGGEKVDFATYAKKVANDKVVESKSDLTESGKKGIKIADPIVPLAETPFEEEDNAQIPWNWLIIIAVLGAAGKKMYDEYKKNQEEAKAAK